MFQFGKITAGFSPFLAGLFALSVMLVASTPAAAATVEERLNALETKVSNLQSRVSTLEMKMVQQTALNNTQINQILSLRATVEKQQRDNLAQGSQISELASKLMHVSREGTNLIITGANLHIVNGLGATDGDPDNTRTPRTNGLGNLIVGYNELRGSGNNRRGSHNLVLGALQNFSSYGGLVAGYQNHIIGAYASVSGGQNNTASGELASVSGGTLNTASGLLASVSGGASNRASGSSASVSGGQANTASGVAASVTGGQVNTASGLSAAVSGGNNNTASGSTSTVSGGGVRSVVGASDWRGGALFQDF